MNNSIYSLASIRTNKRREATRKKWKETQKRAAKQLGLCEHADLERVYIKARAAINAPWVEKQGQKKKIIRQYLGQSKKGFYSSHSWRELRYKALNLYGKCCSCCGATPDTAVLHVDHIKPRSKYPELELDISNLQILCEDCNLGKSNKDEIKHR